MSQDRFRDLPASQCQGKEAFDSMSRARQVARRRRRNERDGQAYHCTFCKRYHIGSVLGAKRKAGKPRRQRDEEFA